MILAIAVCGVSFLAAPPSAATDSSGPPVPAHTFGVQTFPNPNLIHEDAAANLAASMNGALGMNATIGPTRTRFPYGGESVEFFDEFGEFTTLPANGSDFKDPAGTTLSLYYSSETAEFVAFQILFSPPRPEPASSIREYSTSVAAALGISLGNASYTERTDSVNLGKDPNGTGDIVRSTEHGTWRETRGDVPVNFANQIHVAWDKDSRTAQYVRGFRWTDGLPPVQHTPAEAIQAASSAVARDPSTWKLVGASVGQAPNYRNLTWSFFVTLRYSSSGCYTERLAVFLEADTLEFQSVESHGTVVVDPCGGIFPELALGVGLAAGIGVAAAVLWVTRWHHSRNQNGAGRYR